MFFQNWILSKLPLPLSEAAGLPQGENLSGLPCATPLITYGEIQHQVEHPETYRVFVSGQAADRWGEKIYGEWAKSYKRRAEEMKMIFVSDSSKIWSDPICEYCGGAYRHINGALRAEMGSEDPLYHLGRASLLAFNLLYAPRVPENVIAYRQVCDAFVEEMKRANKAGSCVCEKGFLSTSLLPDTGYREGSNLLKIFVPKGTAGVYVNAVPGARREENELLIVPNRFLALTAYPYLDKGLGQRIFECQLLNMEGCFVQ